VVLPAPDPVGAPMSPGRSVEVVPPVEAVPPIPIGTIEPVDVREFMGIYVDLDDEL
jgi:hypothetical protein